MVMGYDLKQIGAKLAKIVATYIVVGGIKIFGRDTVPKAVLTLLNNDAVKQGIGELTEGAILGIQPKEKDVLECLNDDIQIIILEQLKKAKCSNKHVETVCEGIMSALFISPMDTLFVSVDEPQIVIEAIKEIFNDNNILELVDLEEFINNLFSQINQLIDNKYEYTVIKNLKIIDSKIDNINNTAEVNQQYLIDIKNTISNYFSEMVEWRERDYAGIEEEQVKESYVDEAKSHLDVNFQTLKLALQSEVGATTAKRSVKKFLTYVSEIKELLKNSSIADIIEECLKCALEIEKKYNLSYDAHRQYADILWSQQRVSECMQIEDEIIEKLIKHTFSHSFEVAKAYERLIGKCIGIYKFKRKTLSYIINCLDCWIDLIEPKMIDEQLVELAVFFDLVAQFFLIDAEEFVYKIDDCENGVPSAYKLSIALKNIYQLIIELYHGNQFCFDFSIIGFSCVREMLEKSDSFAYQYKQIKKIIKSGADAFLQMEGLPLVDIAEFCAIFAFGLLAGVIVNGQDVPIGYITSIYSTLAMIVGGQQKKELQEQLYQEIAEYIETKDDFEEKFYELSIIYHNLGNYFQENNNSAAAEIYFLYSLEEEKKRAAKNEINCQFSLAMAYFALADFFSIECQNEFKNNIKAIENFEDCVAVFEKIEKTSTAPETYYRYYVESLIKLAERYRIGWWYEAKETGAFSLDNANKVIKILNKSRSLCAKQYHTEPDIFGVYMVKTCIEFVMVLSFLESVLENTTKAEELIDESLQVCFDMLIRHSEAYYKAFRVLFDYLKFGFVQAKTFVATENSAVTRMHIEAIKVYSNIIAFFKDKGSSDKIDPRMLFPPELRIVPTDFVIITNNPPGLFELASSFKTIYNLSLYHLCELYSLTGKSESIPDLLEDARKYIESIKNRIGFFMHDQEMRKIEQIREKFKS